MAAEEGSRKDPDRTVPELAAFVLAIRGISVTKPRHSLCDNQALPKAVKRWVGECKKATLVGAPDADMLRAAIEELRRRTTAGAATFLVKVITHRGEPAMSQVSRRSEIGKHKWRTLNTRLSLGTSTGTFAVSMGPYINYHAKAGTWHVFCTRSKKGLKNRSSRFELNISWNPFSRGSGPPLRQGWVLLQRTCVFNMKSCWGYSLINTLKLKKIWNPVYSISSTEYSFLWKQTSCSVVTQTRSWRGKPSAIGKQPPSACIIFFLTNLVHVFSIEM